MGKVLPLFKLFFRCSGLYARCLFAISNLASNFKFTVCRTKSTDIGGSSYAELSPTLVYAKTILISFSLVSDRPM